MILSEVLSLKQNDISSSANLTLNSTLEWIQKIWMGGGGEDDEERFNPLKLNLFHY